MFTQQFTQTLHWKMPSGRSIAKEYRSRSRWLKQLNNTVNGGADSHEDYYSDPGSGRRVAHGGWGHTHMACTVCAPFHAYILSGFLFGARCFFLSEDGRAPWQHPGWLCREERYAFRTCFE